MNLSYHIKVVGVLLLLLAVSHVHFARRFGWKAEMQRLTLLSRQIFWVHCFFIMLMLVLFGVLSLCYTPMLLRHDPMTKIVLAGMVIFWSARLLAQFFVYDSRLWRGNQFNTVMHGVFSAMWTYYVVVYGIAFWNQFYD